MADHLPPDMIADSVHLGYCTVSGSMIPLARMLDTNIGSAPLRTASLW
jgi:hypothetical protein